MTDKKARREGSGGQPGESSTVGKSRGGSRFPSKNADFPDRVYSILKLWQNRVIFQTKIHVMARPPKPTRSGSAPRCRQHRRGCGRGLWQRRRHGRPAAKPHTKNRPGDHPGTAFGESIFPLPSGFRLLLALHTGLFIVLTLPNLGQNARARALTLKPLESAFQRFVLVDMNLRHLFSLPSHISPETTPSSRCDAG